MATKQVPNPTGNGKQTLVKQVSTKLAKGEATVNSEVTMDFSGVPAEKILEWASRTVAIDWQRVQRDAGAIPTKDKIMVGDFMQGKGRPARAPATPASVAAKVKDTKEAEALIAALQATIKANKQAARK